MNRFFTLFLTIFFILILMTGPVFAGNDMTGHDMSTSDRMGERFHESMVDGYMLSYYLMDLRKQKDDATHTDQGKMEMDKPHHIMVYIMDKNHDPVIKGKVGFLIKNSEGDKQRVMAMYMSKGFGITADLKKRGIYTITTKAVFGEIKLMDSFTYEIK